MRHWRSMLLGLFHIFLCVSKLTRTLWLCRRLYQLLQYRQYSFCIEFWIILVEVLMSHTVLLWILVMIGFALLMFVVWSALPVHAVAKTVFATNLLTFGTLVLGVGAKFCVMHISTIPTCCFWYVLFWLRLTSFVALFLAYLN